MGVAITSSVVSKMPSFPQGLVANLLPHTNQSAQHWKSRTVEREELFGRPTRRTGPDRGYPLGPLQSNKELVFGSIWNDLGDGKAINARRNQQKRHCANHTLHHQQVSWPNSQFRLQDFASSHSSLAVQPREYTMPCPSKAFRIHNESQPRVLVPDLVGMGQGKQQWSVSERTRWQNNVSDLSGKSLTGRVRCLDLHQGPIPVDCPDWVPRTQLLESWKDDHVASRRRK